MRITFFAHGTRGDIWPMVALAWQLARLDHDVTVAVSEEFREFTESAGLRMAPLPHNVVQWLSTSEGQKLLHAGGVSFMRSWQREFSRHAAAFDDAFESIAQGAEALVSNQITLERTQAMGDKLQIPVAIVYPFPLAPSAEYASLPLTGARIPSRTLRRASHTVTHRVWFHGSAVTTRNFRRKLGLPVDIANEFERQQHEGALGLHTVSPSLFPRPTDWPASLKITGAWQMPIALRDSQGELFPAELSAWLDAGDPPVYLGFGSMPVLQPEPLLHAAIAATAQLGLRALLNADWALGTAGLPDNIRLVGAVDHDRLFPRCAAVVHHGGAGSTAASIRAGCPTMVCSVFGDQPWWGNQLERLGVGCHVPFRTLGRDNLLAGLQKLADPALRTRAAALGANIRAEGDGLPAAAQLFDDWLVTAEPTPYRSRRRLRQVRDSSSSPNDAISSPLAE